MGSLHQNIAKLVGVSVLRSSLLDFHFSSILPIHPLTPFTFTPSHDLRRSAHLCLLSESPPSPLFPALFPPIIISGVSDGIRCCLLIASCGTLLQHPRPDTHTQTQTRTPQKMFVCCRNQSVKTNIKWTCGSLFLLKVVFNCVPLYVPSVAANH